MILNFGKSNRSGGDQKNPLNPYARYSGMAVQMVVIIAGGSFGGYKADQWLNLPFPILTVILSLSSVVLAIWLFIKEFNPKNKDHE